MVFSQKFSQKAVMDEQPYAPKKRLRRLYFSNRKPEKVHDENSAEYSESIPYRATESGNGFRTNTGLHLHTMKP